MANGKTIHSSGQMEHHKIMVKDQAHAITNVIPCIKLHEGCRTPLCVINGLPHTTIMSDVPWDPRILDLTPPDEWFSDQPKCLELIEESTFDEHGGHKESLVSTPEDNAEKILDTEKTIDDPNHSKEKLTEDSPIEVSRATMKVCPHNLVHNETVPECRICQVGRHLHEVDIDYRKAAQPHAGNHPRTTRPP
jgi:hypothetical protein